MKAHAERRGQTTRHMKLHGIAAVAATGILMACLTACAPRAVSYDPVPATATASTVDDTLLLYGEHSPDTSPGPIATPDGVRRMLGKRLAAGDASRLIVVLPRFGYLWRTNVRAVYVSLDRARALAAESNVELVRDPSSGSLHAIQPGNWELWLVDDQALARLRAAVDTIATGRVAVVVRR